MGFEVPGFIGIVDGGMLKGKAIGHRGPAPPGTGIRITVVHAGVDAYVGQRRGHVCSEGGSRRVGGYNRVVHGTHVGAKRTVHSTDPLSGNRVDIVGKRWNWQVRSLFAHHSFFLTIYIHHHGVFIGGVLVVQVTIGGVGHLLAIVFKPLFVEEALRVGRAEYPPPGSAYFERC